MIVQKLLLFGGAPIRWLEPWRVETGQKFWRNFCMVSTTCC